MTWEWIVLIHNFYNLSAINILNKGCDKQQLKPVPNSKSSSICLPHPLPTL